MNKIGSQRTNGGNITIYRDEKAKVNPYRLYVEAYYNDGKHEWPTKHKKLIAKYGNLASCTAHIHNYVMQNDEE